MTCKTSAARPAAHALRQADVRDRQSADITADEVYRSGNPGRRRLCRPVWARSAIWVALRKDAVLLGTFVTHRTEVRPFTDKQIALLQNFAARAVVAMENAQLLDEIR